MLEIKYDRYSMIINGRREFIRSGAMHYFRLPSQTLWRDRLYKLKAAGYNTVDLYFCWGYHSPAQGVYDFEGIRNVRELLAITRELGLYVIARPGPYINAEYSGGGFPGWLLAKSDLPLRNRREGDFEWSDEYMQYVREWWEQIIPIINESPNVIMVQIENEYGTLEVEPDYMEALYKMTREMGVKVPLMHNDLYVAGLYEDIVDIYAFDNYSVTQFETNWREMPEVFQVLDNVENNLREFCQNRPLMAAELQAGWFGTWKGHKYEKITELLGREHINISTKSLLGQGLTMFNHYKAIGGTNWDYTGSIETYTSYDFGAPISEAGINTERLFESKALNYFLQSFSLEATDRCAKFPLPLSHPDCFYACRASVNNPKTHWLFLRNLTYEPHVLTVGNNYTVTVNSFEAIILPYQLQLKSGHQLAFCTSELLYQNDTTLIIKADRPVTATFEHAAAGSLATQTDADDLEFVPNDGESVTVHCPELPEQEYRHLRIGSLNVLFLGKQLVDTFWVEEDGNMVMGPDMRLPKGGYGTQGDIQDIYQIPSAGVPVTVVPMPPVEPVAIPPLRDWQIFNDAPELDENTALDSLFEPIKADALDFDANGLYEGSAWYRLPLAGQCPREIQVNARHIWAVFLNGKLIGQGHQLVLIHGMEHPEPTSLSVPSQLWQSEKPNELLIFVDGLGHPKGFHDDAQTPQGLLSLSVDGQPPTQPVQIAGGIYSRRGDISSQEPASFTQSPLVLMRTNFVLPELDQQVASWGVKLQDVDFERINIYLNGILIGRYWRDCRRQEVFYLPQGVLKAEPGAKNRLELVLMNFDPYIDKSLLTLHPRQVTLHPYGIYTKALQKPKASVH